MSLYYKFEFIDPSPIYSEVKEMLSSYFNSGSIDDILFPRWTEHCLRKLGKTQYPIREAIMDIDGYEACLPDDFQSVRELWACEVDYSALIKSPSACYYQEDCRIDPVVDSCHECFGPPSECTTKFMVVNKVTNYSYFTFTRNVLLKPGNMSAHDCCGPECKNKTAEGPNTFTVINNKVVTNIVSGTLHLIYYAKNEGENQMIPKSFRVEDFIRKYLIYMCYLQMSNQVTDETFNQVQQKLIKAEQDSDIAYVMALNELRKQTLEESVRRIGYQSRRFNKKYRL